MPIQLNGLSNKKIICEINMLNYLFHLMFWTNKDLKKFNNIAIFKYFYSLNYKMTSLWVRSTTMLCLF